MLPKPVIIKSGVVKEKRISGEIVCGESGRELRFGGNRWCGMRWGDAPDRDASIPDYKPKWFAEPTQ
jgi:hypothetical protein